MKNAGITSIFAAVTLTASLIAGCGAKVEVTSKVATQENTADQATQNTTPPIEKFLEASNRHFDRGEESCWDYKSELLLVKFSDYGTGNQAVGWSVVTGFRFNSLDNGSVIVIEDDLRIVEIKPDTTDLVCVKK